MAIDVHEHFCTQADLARALNVDRMTVRNWMIAGKVLYQRIGGIVLIEKAELERLKAERSQSRPSNG